MYDPDYFQPLQKALYRFSRFGETTPTEEWDAAVAGATVVAHIHVVPEEWVL